LFLIPFLLFTFRKIIAYIIIYQKCGNYRQMIGFYKNRRVNLSKGYSLKKKEPNNLV